MNITFIGGGNMATAIIGGLLKQGWRASDFRVVEVAAPARERLEAALGVRTQEALDAAAAATDCIVLAVKPQVLRAVAKSLAPFLRDQLVISIAAGIRAVDLARWMNGYQRLVRVMPNTPALVGAGISGLYAMAGVSPEERRRAESVLAAVGATLWLNDESMIDAVTAVSGSGPAYVFLFLEAMQKAGAELGFDAAASRQLALETFAGAVKLAAAGTEDAATLRARVTSKGGTTERAIGIMEAAAVRESIVRAVHGAAERSRELGDEFGRD